MKKKISLLLLSLLLNMPAFAGDGYWVNDLRTLFAQNKAVIMCVNIRTFNANDKNKNDIIEPWLGETSGNFVNAIQRLDAMKKLGVNTLHLLPVTPVGKVKAMGTAGSLYAISSFNEIRTGWQFNSLCSSCQQVRPTKVPVSTQRMSYLGHLGALQVQNQPCCCFPVQHIYTPWHNCEALPNTSMFT